MGQPGAGAPPGTISRCLRLTLKVWLAEDAYNQEGQAWLEVVLDKPLLKGLDERALQQAAEVPQRAGACRRARVEEAPLQAKEHSLHKRRQVWFAKTQFRMITIA